MLPPVKDRVCPTRDLIALPLLIIERWLIMVWTRQSPSRRACECVIGMAEVGEVDCLLG